MAVSKEKRAEYSLRYNEKNREKNRERERRNRREDPRAAMLRSAKYRAKEKGLEFNLTKEDLTVPYWCPILGIAIAVGEGGQTECSPTIDRLDNTKGYVKGNCEVISYRANCLKNHGTLEEIKAVVRYMEERMT